MIIYKTTNLVNGKIYIGYHTRNNDSYLGSGTIIQQSILKYGKENFKRETLEQCDTFEELLDREVYWINELNSQDPNIGYNIRPGGNGGKGGYKNPKVSKSLKQYFKDNDVWNAGTTGEYSDEYIKKLSVAKIEYFKNPNKESDRIRKEKISKFMTYKHPNAKPVLDLRTGIKYPSGNMFRRDTNTTEYTYKKLLKQNIITLI